MEIKFTKMQGLGNDFVVIDAIHQQIHLSSDQIKKIADRHLGVGCDQILLIEKAHNTDTDFFYRIYNSDGSEVAQCGNGARCLAVFAKQKQLIHKDNIVVATNNTIMRLQIEQDGLVSVEMGVPQFSPAEIPLLVEQEALIYSIATPTGDIKFSALSIGNPHAIIQVQDIDLAPVTEIGTALAKHPFFPESVNVGFMQIINTHTIQLRVYERGVGETQACGSGACAAVIAGLKMGLLDEKVHVNMLGGQLQVHWSGAQQPVFLIGPAETVFDGTLKIAT
jgi:diaminopimelate epimerase